jgi:hypothetical protein
VLLGTIVRDTVQIVSSISNSGWNVDILGDIAIYDQAVAEGIYTTRSVILVIRAPRCVTSRQSTKSCSGTRPISQPRLAIRHQGLQRHFG